MYERAPLAPTGVQWGRLAARLVAQSADSKAHLVISAQKPGTIWLNIVSLFPEKTFHDRPNGLRTDLAEKMDDLHPAFIRFTGGCYVEGGYYLANRFLWKETVSDNAHRPGHLDDIWHYWSTDGLGYHEYLQMCEDMHAAPLFVVNCGFSHREVVPMDKLQPYLQDALDAIEYANGPVSGKWGALRAKNGHPKTGGVEIRRDWQ